MRTACADAGGRARALTGGGCSAATFALTLQHLEQSEDTREGGERGGGIKSTNGPVREEEEEEEDKFLVSGAFLIGFRLVNEYHLFTLDLTAE